MRVHSPQSTVHSKDQDTPTHHDLLSRQHGETSVFAVDRGPWTVDFKR